LRLSDRSVPERGSRRGSPWRPKWNRPAPLRLYQRWILGLLLAPCVVTGAAGAAYYYRLHRFCEAMTLTNLPIAPAPTANRRMLVLSPHCDDETLGVGGQIAEATRAGVPVTVGFLTNGDGFRLAASRSLREVNVRAGDFVRFAELRQQESLAALHELGVPADNVKFLGYPDRGLKPMWETNWNLDHAFRSGFTGFSRSPYPRTYTPNAPYAGQSVVADLARLMESTRPTDILVTHPADDHPDHSAAAAFTEAALQTCRDRGDSWAQSAHLHFYIVHRGDWPLPQGDHPGSPLLPPPGLVTGDAHWNVCPLSDRARAAKARALSQYSSQMGISGRFLSSFVRSNELYADLPTPGTQVASTIKTGVNTVDGALNEGAIAVCETAAANLSGDNLARFVEPAGDITDLTVSRTDKMLTVRLRTRTDASPRIRYAIAVRGCTLGPDGVERSRLISVGVTVPTLMAGRDGHEIGAVFPLSSLGLGGGTRGRCVWVSAESRWMNHLPTIDRTGYREFRLDDGRRSLAARPAIRRVVAHLPTPLHGAG
jgi:LmbE family N-acetylglucosaminyl deacetylase